MKISSTLIQRWFKKPAAKINKEILQALIKIKAITKQESADAKILEITAVDLDCIHVFVGLGQFGFRSFTIEDTGKVYNY